jgi:tetratricopeptide (TPR) repeat protein
VELRKAVDLAPANADFLEELATVLAMEKKFDESTSYFQRALKIDPQNAVARRYLAANLWQLHRYAEARRNLRLLFNANPGDPQALLLFGMVSENTRDYATAAKTLASVPTLVRAQPESVAALARSYYHIGEAEKARAWLNELQNHPAGVQAAFLGAQIADEMRDYKTAETLLSSVAPRYSDRNDLRYRIALVKFHAQQFEESRQLLQELLVDGDRTSKVNRLLASCFLAQNLNEEAIHALQEAIEFDPLDETSYLDLASILLGQKRISQAMDLAQRMAKAFPDSSRVFVSKGSIELGANDFIDAVGSFTRAAQLEPNSSDATIGLARAEANAGMTERAKATLDSGIRRFPEKAPFELELGLMLLKEGETGDKPAEVRAEQLFNSAVAHDGKLAEAHYELGELALHRGETSRALIHLEKAAKLAPSSAKTHFALSRVYRRLGREREAAEQAALFDKLRE